MDIEQPSLPIPLVAGSDQDEKASSSFVLFRIGQKGQPFQFIHERPIQLIARPAITTLPRPGGSVDLKMVAHGQFGGSIVSQDGELRAFRYLARSLYGELESDWKFIFEIPKTNTYNVIRQVPEEQFGLTVDLEDGTIIHREAGLDIPAAGDLRVVVQFASERSARFRVRGNYACSFGGSPPASVELGIDWRDRTSVPKRVPVGDEYYQDLIAALRKQDPGIFERAQKVVIGGPPRLPQKATSSETRLKEEFAANAQAAIYAQAIWLLLQHDDESRKLAQAAIDECLQKSKAPDNDLPPTQFLSYFRCC